MAIIAPFWAPVDMYWAFVIGRSKVYYHVYDKREDDPAAKDVLDMASDHVRQYQKSNQFAKFKAKWVAVVTWENLCPYTWYRYWYYEFLLQNTCQLVSTLVIYLIHGAFSGIMTPPFACQLESQASIIYLLLFFCRGSTQNSTKSRLKLAFL